MKIYTGIACGKKFQKLKELGLGVMVSTSPDARTIGKHLREVPCVLDNGAFRAWQLGYPFQGWAFRRTVRQLYTLGIKLEWIVCPDIVAGGRKSLDFSLSYAEKFNAPNLALVAQDGMELKDVQPWMSEQFKVLFMGGTKEWKWRTAEAWRDKARELGWQFHIGRCGTLAGLRRAAELGADSVDSTSFARNGSWHIVEEFLGVRELIPTIVEESDGDEGTDG